MRCTPAGVCDRPLRERAARDEHRPRSPLNYRQLAVTEVARSPKANSAAYIQVLQNVHLECKPRGAAGASLPKANIQVGCRTHGSARLRTSHEFARRTSGRPRLILNDSKIRAHNTDRRKRNTVQPKAVNLAYAEPCPNKARLLFLRALPA